MSVAKGGGVEGVASGRCGELDGFGAVRPANHDLQSVEHYGKTHANHCKSMRSRLQIKTLFPKLCKAHANHDLRLDLQLAACKS